MLHPATRDKQTRPRKVLLLHDRLAHHHNNQENDSDLSGV